MQMATETENESVAKTPEPEKENFATIAVGFLGNTSAHGLPRVASEKSVFRRIVWLLIFLLAFGYFVQQFTTQWRRFQEHPIAVTAGVKRRTRFPFPAVTVCNQNILMKSKLNDTAFSSLLVADANAETFVGSLTEDTNSRRKRGTNRNENGNDNNLIEIVERLVHLGASNDDIVKTLTLLEKNGWVHDDIVRKRMNQPNQTHNSLASSNTSRARNDRLGKISLHKLLTGNLQKEVMSEGTHSDDPRVRRDVDDYEDTGASDDYDYDEYDYSSQLGADAACSLENAALCGLGGNSFDKAISISKTDDMSDLSDLLVPSWEELEHYGHRVEEMIGQCSFDNTPCSYKDFDVFRASDVGNCFVFNSLIHGRKRIRTTNKSGSRYGLRLTLRLSLDDYVGLMAHEASAVITIHPPKIHPFPNDNGVSAGTGLKTLIGVQLKQDTRLPHPYPSNCSDGTETNLDYPGNYTKLACIETCQRRHIKDACGCLPNSIKANDTNLCIGKKLEYCKTQIIVALNNRTLDCDCRPACHEESHQLTLSSVPWPSARYAPYVIKKALEANWMTKKDAINNEMNSGLVRVHIFMEEKDVITMEEYPSYAWESLMADIGGFLGLFIGVSVCTVLEVIEFFIDIIIFMVATRRRRDRINIEQLKNNSNRHTEQTDNDQGMLKTASEPSSGWVTPDPDLPQEVSKCDADTPIVIFNSEEDLEDDNGVSQNAHNNQNCAEENNSSSNPETNSDPDNGLEHSIDIDGHQGPDKGQDPSPKLDIDQKKT